MDWSNEGHKGHFTLVSPEGLFTETYELLELQMGTKRRGDIFDTGVP